MFFKPLRLNWKLFAISLLITSLGLIVIYGIDAGRENNFHFFKRQLLFFAIGVIIFLTSSFFNYKIFRAYAYPIYTLAILCLIFVLIFGVEIRGTKGWFTVGPFNIQVVEFAKIALIIALSRFFVKKAYNIKKFRFIVTSGILISPAIFLTLLEPDFGSTLVLVLIWLGMLLAGGIGIKQIFSIGLIGIITFAFAWNYGFANYQKDRILTFVDPARASPQARYNVEQSIIAIGSGKFFGRGLTESSQSQLKFLPEAYTDFIFASMGENFGFMGALLLLGLFGAFFYLVIKNIKTAHDDFGIFLSIGILIYFAVQIFLNISMNIGIAPVTGLPLPLVSYGGSSLVVSFILLGILNNVLVNRLTHP